MPPLLALDVPPRTRARVPAQHAYIQPPPACAPQQPARGAHDTAASLTRRHSVDTVARARGCRPKGPAPGAAPFRWGGGAAARDKHGGRFAAPRPMRRLAVAPILPDPHRPRRAGLRMSLTPDGRMATHPLGWYMDSTRPHPCQADRAGERRARAVRSVGRRGAGAVDYPGLRHFASYPPNAHRAPRASTARRYVVSGCAAMCTGTWVGPSPGFLHPRTWGAGVAVHSAPLPSPQG